MKLNIVVDDDKCWNLNTVKRLIVYLNKKGILIDHIWILPNKLSNLKKSKISIWYLKTFGIFTFFKLSLFYLFVIVNNFLINIKSFEALSLRYNLKLKYINGIDDKIFLNDLKKKK